MKFWKEHPVIRVLLITVLFAAGLATVRMGWKMTGRLDGLLLMLGGLALVLWALFIYNRPFEDDR